MALIGQKFRTLPRQRLRPLVFGATFLTIGYTDGYTDLLAVTFWTPTGSHAILLRPAADSAETIEPDADSATILRPHGGAAIVVGP
jgi:hypothetical protein